MNGWVRRVLVALACCVLVGATSAAAAFATTWTGWGASNYKEGIRGYLQQNLAGGSFTSGNRSTWVGLYKPGISHNWSQAGLFQGYFQGGNSLGAVHMFYENKQQCGHYIGVDLGVPPSQPYFFSIKNTGNLVGYPCIDIDGFFV